MKTNQTILGILCVFCGALSFSGNAAAVDLAKVYPATLDYFEGQPTREWTCTKDDAWALESFHYEFGDKLSIDAGKSTVIFAVHAKNVVWAVLLPSQPATVKTTNMAGDGAKIESIWMRFNPARLAELFPDATVVGNDAPEMIIWAKRICAWKIRSGWQANDLPVIPMKSSLVFDVDTLDHQRHYYVVDTDKQTVQHIDAFNTRATPALVFWEKGQSLRAFETVWDAFDREYAKFIIRPDIDWNGCRERFRPKAERAITSYETALVIGEMLAELRDLHIYVQVNGEFVPGFNRERPLNASLDATRRKITGWTQLKKDIIWGKTDDGIGYINIHALGDKQTPAAFDEVLDKLSDTWALIVDLRFNGGGDELIGREITGRFLDKKRTYSTNQYRSGPRHDELGNKLERSFEPRGPWRYESPVAVLWGQRTMSSAESFALMFAQCPNVTTIGDRTAGASANPRRIELEGGIIVNLPRWLDMDPDGKSIEDVGIEPRIKVEAKPEEFTSVADPVLEKALEVLRTTPERERAAGKRAK